MSDERKSEGEQGRPEADAGTGPGRESDSADAPAGGSTSGPDPAAGAADEAGGAAGDAGGSADAQPGGPVQSGQSDELGQTEQPEQAGRPDAEAADGPGADADEDAAGPGADTGADAEMPGGDGSGAAADGAGSGKDGSGSGGDASVDEPERGEGADESGGTAAAAGADDVAKAGSGSDAEARSGSDAEGSRPGSPDSEPEHAAPEAAASEKAATSGAAEPTVGETPSTEDAAPEADGEAHPERPAPTASEAPASGETAETAPAASPSDVPAADETAQITPVAPATGAPSAADETAQITPVAPATGAPAAADETAKITPVAPASDAAGDASGSRAETAGGAAPPVDGASEAPRENGPDSEPESEPEPDSESDSPSVPQPPAGAGAGAGVTGAGAGAAGAVPGWAAAGAASGPEPADRDPGHEPAAASSGSGRRRTGLRRLIPTWRWVLGSFMFVLVLGVGVLVAGYLLVSIPEPNKAAAAQTNVYLYSDGSQIARDGEINRENVKLSEVPKSTQEAVLAAEDREFFEESAVDPKAMVRAAWNMLTGGEKQSGSTITQQYVKNYYLNQGQTLTRKAKEFFIALKLGNEVPKSDILEGYLNTSYFGRNAYGIQAAAHAYYGKDADELTPGEGAYLAALVNSPNAYDTQAHPENRARAVARWHYVLDGMVEKRWMTRAQSEKLDFPEPRRGTGSTGMSGQRGYIVEAVKNYLISNGIVDERRLAAGGFRITTTLDPERQKAMGDAVEKRLMSKLDDSREVDKHVRAGGTSIDPETGKIVAMYGGVDYTKQYVNNATRRDYQVGSTFKPFLFTSALQNRSKTQDGRSITAGTAYDGTNKREVVSDGVGTGYKPENEDEKSYGQIPVSEAMNKSVNSVFAQMGIDVGPRKVKQTAIDLGLPEKTPNMPENGSIALGVATASTTDMAQAYATLANHGKRGHYSLVEKATRGGEIIELPAHDPRQEVPRDAADSTTAVLRKVVENGTGVAAQAAGRPAAGKTGTAEEDKAAWFAGYTPELATVIGVMGQNSETGVQKPLYGAAGVERVNGGGFPAEIWGDYTKAALEGEPVRDFKLKTGGGGDVPSTSPSEPGTSQSPGEPGTTAPPTDPTAPPTDPGPPSTPPSEPPTGPGTPPTGGLEGGNTEGNQGGVDGGNTTGDPGGGNGANGGWQGGNTNGGQAAARTEPTAEEYAAGWD